MPSLLIPARIQRDSTSKSKFHFHFEAKKWLPCCRCKFAYQTACSSLTETPEHTVKLKTSKTRTRPVTSFQPRTRTRTDAFHTAGICTITVCGTEPQSCCSTGGALGEVAHPVRALPNSTKSGKSWLLTGKCRIAKHCHLWLSLTDWNTGHARKGRGSQHRLVSTSSFLCSTSDCWLVNKAVWLRHCHGEPQQDESNRPKHRRTMSSGTVAVAAQQEGERPAPHLSRGS